MDADLKIENLSARVEGAPILRGVDLTVRPGEVHALMGPNGSGKSTLSNVIMGHPDYEVTGGALRYGGHDLLELSPDERARRRLFLAFQYPVAIPGVTVAKFLKRAVDSVGGENGRVSASAFLKELRENVAFLEMDPSFINRYLNEGFSGGEKKRMEILQMLMLKPRLAVMDETDSGLDIDALRIVSKGVNRLRGGDFALLLITHYERILKYIEPDFVHIFLHGRVALSGGRELVRELEEKGYDWIRDQAGGLPAGEASS
jgi:Fe-S cluster assembly ATP-binding protein